MQVFLKALLFFLLLTTGACLKCETCMKNSNITSSTASINCNGPLKTCAGNGKTCTLKHIEHNLDGVTKNIVERSCDSSDVCDHENLHFHVGPGRQYKSTVICCNGKACPKGVPLLPPESRTPSGKECPACFVWSKICEAKTIKCVGSDTHCIDIRSTTKTRPDGRSIDSVIKGCTSEAVCKSIKKEKAILFTGEINEVVCDPEVSKGSQPTSFLLPTVSGLLLMKIFG